MSIKTNNNKFTLLNQRIKYGTDGGINVRGATLYTDPSSNRVGINRLSPQYLLDISGSIKYNSLIDTSRSSGNDTQIFSRVNNQNLWSYNQYNFNASNMFPNQSVGVSYLTNYIAPNQGFFGSVLGPNGKIYVTPYSNSGQSIVIDTYTDTWNIQNITGVTLNSFCIGGVCASNGKIYCPSISAATGSNVATTLVYDISNNRYYNIFVNTGSLYTGYAGCCLGPNGKIYCIPRFADNVLVINPVDDSYSFITSPDVNISTDRKWLSGSLALNGKIYCNPARATSILVIDTINDTMSASIPGLSGIPASVDEGKYWGGCLAPNGKIYCCPQNSVDISAGSKFLEIDPSTDTYKYVGATYSGSRKYTGALLGLDGNIYCGSDNAGDAIRFNPNTYAVTTIPTSTRLWSSTLAPNGKIYFYPRQGGSTASSILNSIRIVDTGLPQYEPWMMAPEFNKL